MKQLHFNYTDGREYETFLREVRAAMDENPDAQALVHFLSDTADRAVVEQAASVLRAELPGVPYLGGSTGGNICDGAFVGTGPSNLTVICNIFEDPQTKLEVHQFPLDEENRAETTNALLQLVADRPWVKAVEMLTTVIDVSMNDFRGDLGRMRENIVLFGGGVLESDNVDIFTGLPFVCSSDGGSSGHSIAFALYGGERFHATTQAIIGWKPFGLPLQITRADGPTLYELDGVPAFERYHHYLSIDNDENFAERSLIFPLMIEYEGHSVIKAPLKVGDDGSIALTSDLASYHDRCRIAYGDPATILKSIKEASRALQAFAPQGVFAFSCAARLMYWGPEYVSGETLPFQRIAPTAGFYTGGEFSRDEGRVLHHNVTLVVVGLREGDPASSRIEDAGVGDEGLTRQMTIVRSLAAFVGVMSSELREAYDRMEHVAKSDGLTGIWNRHEIEARIDTALEGLPHGAQPPSVIMLDLDNFKVINDAYGHKAGDDVLKGIGALLRRAIEDVPGASAGRWGGEEFMVLAPATPIDKASALAQRICDDFAELNFPASGRHTLSVGVAQTLSGETTDLLCQRVDKALYAAKKKGKNCVVVA